MKVKEITVRKLITYERFNNISVGLTIELQEGENLKDAYIKAVKTIDTLLSKYTKKQIEQWEEFEDLPF